MRRIKLEDVRSQFKVIESIESLEPKNRQGTVRCYELRIGSKPEEVKLVRQFLFWLLEKGFTEVSSSLIFPKMEGIGSRTQIGLFFYRDPDDLTLTE